MLNDSPWTAEEDALLLDMRFDGRSWGDIFTHLSGRSSDAIKSRYEKLTDSVVQDDDDDEEGDGKSKRN